MTQATGNFILQEFEVHVNGSAFTGSPNHILELHYIEDITKSNNVMVLTVNDTETAFVSELFGLEPIRIKFADHRGNTIVADMIIYEIKDRMIVSGKKMKASLYCVSRDAVNNAAAKISKRFGKGDGEKISKITSDLLKKTLGSRKSLDIDTTATKISFISPYWDPFTIIQWMAWRAIPEKASGSNVSAGYLFYETPEKYHFKSMDELVKGDVVKTIRVNYESEEDDDDFIDIESLSLPGTSDVFRGFNLGSYTSVMMTLDIKDFTYTELPFNVNEYYSKMEKLNPDMELPQFYSLFGETSQDSSPTRIMSSVIDLAMYTEGTYTQDLTKQLSQSMLRNQFFFNQSATFEYEGPNDLRIGDVVEVQTFKGKSLDKDERQSGKYIVGKIYRQFVTDRDMMSTRVTLYRDSLG